MTDVTGTKILEQNLCTMLSEEVTREVTREGLLAGNLSFHSQYKTDSPDLQVVGDAMLATSVWGKERPHGEGLLSGNLSSNSQGETDSPALQEVWEAVLTTSVWR